MVIPVCFKCQNPVKIKSASQDGLEIISYHCPDCNASAASFLLGYVELDLDELSPEDGSTVNGTEIERAKFFEHNNQHYKLRAKMQGLLELRAEADNRRKSPSNSADGAMID